MKLLCVGLNWKTPIDVRERIAFDAASLGHALKELRRGHAETEFAILSTCNRTELYAGWRSGSTAATMDDLVRFLSQFRDISLDQFHPHLYMLENRDAVAHLFEVSSGLDSLVLGESQILAQVKDAYQAAVDHKSAGPILHTVFQKALQVGKRVRTETGLGKGRFSIASAAVDYIRGVFETFDDKTVLVIGAGKMAELTVTHLMHLRPARLVVVNRSRENALLLSQRHGGEPWEFERLRDALVEADIVVSSTASTEPIVYADVFRAIMKERQHRLIAILDIALPRDFDVAISEIENVLLWNIDDLEKVRQETIRSRRAEFETARNILAEALRAFESDVAKQKSAPIISQLEQEYQRIIDDELAWLWPQLNGLEEDQREKIRHFAHRIKNKLLHPPKQAIREDARQGHHGILETVQRLFGLLKDD